VSYCYLRQLLDDECPPSLIDWSRFSATATSLDTTLWIGTAGSFTPCHYDSYGCNWVAQIDGRKRWRVWPPHATPAMAPTRVPFEESTVWSALPVAQLSGGFEAVLEPGDVLFVPRHWWHFVESLTDSVAANLWVPHVADTAEAESEAGRSTARRRAGRRATAARAGAARQSGRGDRLLRGEPVTRRFSARSPQSGAA
jgi:HSPB1-associated protein 1